MKQPIYPIMPLDVPEDYSKRLLKQVRALFLLGENLPFVRNLFQYIEEGMVLFIIYSNFRKGNIRFNLSEKRFQIVPRSKMVFDTLSAYFDDFIDWQEELFRKSIIGIDFGEAPSEYVGDSVECLLALADYPLDFGFVLSEFYDPQKIESMFKTLRIRKRRTSNGFQKLEQFVYFIQAGAEEKVKIGK